MINLFNTWESIGILKAKWMRILIISVVTCDRIGLRKIG